MYLKLTRSQLFPIIRRNFSINSNCRLIFQPKSLPQNSKKCLANQNFFKSPFVSFQFHLASTSASIFQSPDNLLGFSTAPKPEPTPDLSVGSGWDVPEPPPLPSDVDFGSVLGTLEEALPMGTPGLGESSWFLSNWLSQSMDFLHSSTGLPWWACIAGTVVVFRGVLVPFMIRTQRDSAKMINMHPETSKINAHMKEARKYNNTPEVNQLFMELRDVYKKNGVSMYGAVLNSGPQAVVFISYYFALRNMAEGPIPGFQTEGLLWFPDLSIPDPTVFCLPLVCCSMLFVNLLYMVNFGPSAASMTRGVKYILPVALPLVAFGFMWYRDFPAAILLYWTITNAITVSINMALQNRSVQKWCKIEERKTLDTKALAKNKIDVRGRMRKIWRRVSEGGKRSLTPPGLLDGGEVSSNVMAVNPNVGTQKLFRFNPMEKQKKKEIVKKYRGLN